LTALPDPVIGFLSDRVRTRWGRRKPFVLIGMPIFMLGVWLLWIPPIEFTEVTWLGMTFNTGYPYLLGVLVIMYVGRHHQGCALLGLGRRSSHRVITSAPWS
jgi:Na+/melibiose symporter-like transporter